MAVISGGFVVRVYVDGHLVFTDSGTSFPMPSIGELSGLRAVRSSQNSNVADTSVLYMTGYQDSLSANNWLREVFYSTTEQAGTNP